MCGPRQQIYIFTTSVNYDRSSADAASSVFRPMAQNLLAVVVESATHLVASVPNRPAQHTAIPESNFSRNLPNLCVEGG